MIQAAVKHPDLLRSKGQGTTPPQAESLKIILSFDVEDHHRIEAAANLAIDIQMRQHSQQRVEPATCWLLDQLGERRVKASFFIVGEIAQRNPALVRRIYADGHEIACHSLNHERLHRLTPDSFREDVRRSLDELAQITGAAVLGYRAPTFSIDRQTAWAIDVLAELGVLYDSSIYPVRHDRYGVPGAPRGPFWAGGRSNSLLELPPLTLRFAGLNLPIGGGGYFRLLPRMMMEAAFRQVKRRVRPSVAMLYFHPWEFDPEQLHLPIGKIAAFRTYTGIRRSRSRMQRFLDSHQFERAVDVAQRLLTSEVPLPHCAVA